jgi:hypothetical protein
VLRVVSVALLQAIGEEARPVSAPDSLVAWVSAQLEGDAPGSSSQRPVPS